uniref:Uncharacterized protein n=1 Tax=Rhizophagus irregularis (strain DAOM 181602 / DAOM 197198 / MUCL 43194) TaxID=747089 RepID=U9UCM4_RHIID
MGRNAINEKIVSLEYADSVTLNKYLNNHFDELSWNDKTAFTVKNSTILYNFEEKC